jgi:NADH dehydrogenase
MLAQVAIQQGELLGKNIMRKISALEMLPFSYNDKGSLATIGRNKAVADLKKHHFSGTFAWFIWIFVHLFALIGFKNKAMVLLNWIHNYIRFDREGRLIIRPYKKKNDIIFTSEEV